jgi:hypothetical protein
MQRGIFEELLACALNPNVGSIANTLAELGHQSRLADSRLADDQHHLALPVVGALPTGEQHTGVDPVS